MADDLSDRWAKLKITDEECDVAELGEANEDELKGSIELSLVGKLLTIRAYNFEVMQRTLSQIWALNKGVIFRRIENNLFVVQLFHWRDKEKVIDGAPWTFDNHLILLKEMHHNEQPENVEIKYCPFWLRLYNLPFDSRSNADVRLIPEKIGIVLEVEDDVLGWDKSRRVRVLVDTTKALRRLQKIRCRDGSTTTVHIKYERLSIFYFLCGLIGHSERDCPTVDDESEEVEKQ
ncbi:uncharacterized protein LOC110727283 [Chenopodium quinoa]|uniref:uncharacterized protein LOC110727283 n=1 Tax=Chenopodium quinoa TaxID=63459 RepID=UPI000B76E972|nr:uncharacterized protein LOC110727283 [Chenopodium quinoa]